MVLRASGAIDHTRRREKDGGGCGAPEIAGGKRRREDSHANSKRRPMGQPVVHFEIGCKDSARTQEFYAKLFDWKIEAMGPAAMIAAEAGGITGHITALGHDPHHYTIFYVDVDDVAAYLEKAKSLGGKMLVPPVEIPTG